MATLEPCPEPKLEPWMRGTLTGLNPVLAAVLYSFQHAREDLDKWTKDLNDKDLSARPFALAPVAFQIRHIAGSVDRLMTYACGKTRRRDLPVTQAWHRRKSEGRPAVH